MPDIDSKKGVFILIACVATLLLSVALILIGNAPATRYTAGNMPPQNDTGNLSASNQNAVIDNRGEQEAGEPKEDIPPQDDVVILGPSLYRNSEFGFEVSIPDGWQARENLYKTPNTYFNLSLEPSGGTPDYPDPVMINVARTEFIERSYSSLKRFSSAVTVDGMTGLKYDYPFEGSENIDILIPRPKDIFIIGCWKSYEKTFNEVLSSLKFLK